MKKTIALLCIFMVNSIYPSVSYNQLKEHFKEKLYKTQEGLMKYKDYINFIEPHLIEAEDALIILSTVSKMTDINNDNAYLLGQYVNHLISLKSLMFHRLVLSNDRLPYCATWVLKDIKIINEAFNLNIDPEVEFQRTVIFLKKVNQDFYKQLGSIKRCKIHIRKGIDRFKKYVLALAYFPICPLMSAVVLLPFGDFWDY